MTNEEYRRLRVWTALVRKKTKDNPDQPRTGEELALQRIADLEAELRQVEIDAGAMVKEAEHQADLARQVALEEAVQTISDDRANFLKSLSDKEDGRQSAYAQALENTNALVGILMTKPASTDPALIERAKARAWRKDENV